MDYLYRTITIYSLHLLVIHHIHCIKDRLLVVGYKNLEKGGEPSLGFLKVNSFTASGSFRLFDLNEKVCGGDLCEVYNLHKYFTSFVEAW